MVDKQFEKLCDDYTILVMVESKDAELISEIAKALNTTPASILHQLIHNKFDELRYELNGEEDE